MLYRLAQNAQDSVAVPRLIFSRLTAQGPDSRFRVALYLVASGEADAPLLAKELGISAAEAEQALQYWEGAGLVVRQAAAPTPGVLPEKRRRMNTREVAEAGEGDTMLGGMVAELQRIFGGIVSQSDINIYVTLYCTDEIPADLILLAATYFASKGKTSARYIEKTLLSWRREGIEDAASADRYLQQLAQREHNEAQVAQLLGIAPSGLTLAERKRISKWFEEYGYGLEMLRTARLYAGEKQDSVRYLDGILSKWFAKGWLTPQQVQAGAAGRNLRTQSETTHIPKGEDLLAQVEYVPLDKQRRRAQ